jgi:hypothetical protein
VGLSPHSVPHTTRNGVMSVGERTLSYRENDWVSQPDLVRTKWLFLTHPCGGDNHNTCELDKWGC